MDQHKQYVNVSSSSEVFLRHLRVLTMYIGEPHRVAAIMLLCRYRAKPKSAGEHKNCSLIYVSINNTTVFTL